MNRLGIAGSGAIACGLARAAGESHEVVLWARSEGSKDRACGKVEDAATGNTGVWITFVAVVLLYIGVAVTTILVLRGMSRRFRENGAPDEDVPYGPRVTTASTTGERDP